MKNSEEQENEKVKKPIYKRWWFIAIGVIAIITIIVNLPGEKVKWSSLNLGNHLPEPTKGKVDVGSDLEDILMLSIDDVKKSYYEKYLEMCIEKGYTIESKKSGTRYEAFNNEGYELSIYYSGGNIELTLEAPEKMENITWPTTGLGAILPSPKSNTGKVNSDSSDTFRIHMGNMTIDDFNSYIENCKAKGFTIDYNKQEKNYSAKNSEGYRLSLQYLGFNTVDILIQVPSENKPSNNSNNTDDIRKDFKEAMDKYETFIDEYVAFMKKYKNSNGADLNLINDYTKYLEKYTEMLESFEKWESSDMTTKEAAYYLEVQTRVSKKLLEVAN